MQLSKKEYSIVSVCVVCPRIVFETKWLNLSFMFLRIKPSGHRQQSRKVRISKAPWQQLKSLFKVKFNHTFGLFFTGGQAVRTV